MRRRHSRSALTAALAISSTAIVLTVPPSAWEVAEGRVSVRCPLTVGGSFDATTSAIQGELSPDPSRQSAFSGELSVDLGTLDTGIGLRNTHLRENYLEVTRGDGFDHAVLSDVALAAGDAATFEGRTGFSGTLLLHGVRKSINGNARIRRSGGDAQIEAGFPVRLPEFGIPEPRYLGVGVKDEVQVTVTFRATAPASGTAGL
jgi:polyisoprenoid-binding protein YceI